MLLWIFTYRHHYVRRGNVQYNVKLICIITLRIRNLFSYKCNLSSQMGKRKKNEKWCLEGRITLMGDIIQLTGGKTTQLISRLAINQVDDERMKECLPFWNYLWEMLEDRCSQ